MRKLPVLSVDLIAELDADFPEKCAELHETEREIFIRTGARLLVRSLMARAEALRDEQIS